MVRVWLLCLLLVATLGAVLPTLAADAPAPIAAPTDADKALAARAFALVKEVQGTPGQEAANFLNDWPGKLARMLAGEVPANAGDLNFARSMVGELVGVMEISKTMAKPPSLKVPRARRAPIIDGKLDDAAWKRALVIKGAYVMNSLEKSDTTIWRLCWDKQYLYVGIECRDADIIAPVVERDGPVYATDCVEAFVLPDFATRTYWELEFGPTGSVFDSACVKAPDNWGGKTDNTATMAGLRSAVVLTGTANTDGDTDTGYTLEVAIPINQLPGMAPDATAKAGMKMHLMLARMDKHPNSQHFYGAWPLLSWTHNIWNYAPITLKR